MDIYSSAAAMRHLEVWQSTVAQNLAAGPQPGFKAVQVSLEKPAPTVEGKELPLHSNLVRDFSAAPARRTDRSLDVALGGEGFLVATDPAGQTALLRNGGLQLDQDGMLTSGMGWILEGADGPIQTLPNAPDPSIDEHGGVWQGATQIGRIRVVAVENPNALIYDGSGYRLPPERPAAVALRDLDEPDLRPGYLEEANHSSLRSMVTLMQISRAFEANQKALQAQDAAVEATLRTLF